MMQEKMNSNTIWNAFSNNTITTESVQFDLTHTVLKQASNKDPSSLLSLSNYLQYDDESIFYHEKYPDSSSRCKDSQETIIKKSYLLLDDRKNNKKSHMIQSFNRYEQESESMLLLDSEIKQNSKVCLENCRSVESKYSLSDSDVMQIKSDRQSDARRQVCSQIYEKSSSSSNKNYCTDSLQLMDLLSIPKDSHISMFRQSIKLLSKNEQENQDEKMNKIIKMFYQNLKKQDKPCHKCTNYQKRIKILQQFLNAKEKQISKYEDLIDQLNSKMFDLKIQNKRLTFQNQKYSTQLQDLMSKNIKITSKQSLNTINHEVSEDTSFFDDDKFGVINSAVVSRVLSRKDSLKQEMKFKSPFGAKKQKQNYLQSPGKAYPQTPMPTMTYLKPKKQRKPSNFSDHSMEISISKVKQPSLYQIAQMKIDKILKQNNIKYVDKEKQTKHKSQQSIKRFSDILNEGKNKKSIDIQDEIKPTKDQDGKMKNNSPSKKYDFYKIKAKNSVLNNDLKNHLINKLFRQQQEDNFSESSQTKTQKLCYGTKNIMKNQFLLQQNDYMLLNRINMGMGLENCRNRLNLNLNKNAFEKNQVPFKSFKEIGTSNNENAQNKQVLIQQNKNRNKSPYLSRDEYGMHLNMKNAEKICFFDKPERKCFSPSPNALGMRRQNTERSKSPNSPYTKQTPRQTEIKSFLR